MKPQNNQSNQETEECLNSFLEEFCTRHGLGENTPGFALLIQKNKTPLYSYTTGVLNNRHDKITPESNFRLASISKQFTAVCILQLIEKGLLSFETTLTELFPDFPTYGGTITIHHLLTHTSGIEDYEDDLDLVTDDYVSDAEVLNIAKTKEKGLFKPGSEYRYSNGGYCILALIITKISGLSFDAYLNKNIFTPATMKNATLNTATNIKQRAYGYAQDENGVWVLKDQDKTSMTQGDGGIYASCHSLMAWHESLHKTNDLLSKKSHQWMTHPHVLKNKEGESYGGGINIRKINNVTCYRHGGSSIGFSNALFYFPERDLSLCILSNLNGIEMTEVILKSPIFDRIL